MRTRPRFRLARAARPVAAWLALLPLLLLLAGPARAATQESAERAVDVLVYLADVHSIDDEDQSVEIDFALWLMWDAPELAHDGPGPVMHSLSEVWHPDVQILNGMSLSKHRDDLIEVQTDGSARHRQRYSGRLLQFFDFREFPLDQQVIRIRGVGTRPDSTRFVPDPRTERAHPFSIQDWSLGEGDLRNEDFVGLGRSYPAFVYEVPARRHVAFYLIKVFLPLSFVVLMSWAVFWIPPKLIAPQVGLAATSVLTLIAYRFALEQTVPNLSYLTRMDQFVFGASILVFGVLIEAVITSSLTESDRGALALRIDRTCRWVFPLSFLAVAVYAFLS